MSIVARVVESGPTGKLVRCARRRGLVRKKRRYGQEEGCGGREDPDSGGGGYAGAAGGHRARPARRGHHGLLQGLQRGHRSTARHDRARSRSRSTRTGRFTFILKTPPTLGADQAGRRPRQGGQRAGRESAGSITDAQVAEIAKIKMPDLNADDLDAAKLQVAGTARSMGISVD